MALIDSLTALANAFSVNLLPPAQPPLPEGTFRAQLVQPPARDGALSVPGDPTSVIEAHDMSFDLGWIAKGVRFNTLPLADNVPFGGMPIADPIPIPVGSTFEALLDPFTEGPLKDAQNAPRPGVPGVLGRLTGDVGVPLEVTRSLDVPVTVAVRWTVRDEQGNAVGEFTMNPAAPAPADIVSFAFKAAVAELTNAPAPVVNRRIEASIKLTAGVVATDWIALPPVTVAIPVLRIPTIAALFQDRDFGNSRLVLVPSDSPLAGEAVDDALNALAAALNTLPLPSFVDRTGLLAAVDGQTRIAFFAGLVPDPTNGIAFRKADGIANLNDVVIWDTGVFFLNNTEAEDEITSMLLIGPPGRKLEAFIARDFSDHEGQVNLVVGPELWVDVGDMKSKSPGSVPAGRIEVPRTPGRGGIWPVEWEVDFSDSLSSVRFTWA